MLTRNLLILVKSIPMVQNMFFSMIEKEMRDFIDFPSLGLGTLDIKEIDHKNLMNINDLETN